MSLDTYENVKSIVEKETKLLNDSGIITNEQEKHFNGQFISFDEQKNYVDVDPPPTSNEYSHSLYNRSKNYLNKKLLNSLNGKIFIKTRNNLYLEYDDEGQLKLVNIENIENKDNIVWSFMGGNSDHMRFVTKDGAFLRVNPNYRVSIPVLQVNKEDTKSGSNLWKIIKREDSYLLESTFYKSHFLDHNLNITEGVSEAKKWILEPVPIINTVTYEDITSQLMDEKEEYVDNYIKLRNKLENNRKVLKEKIDNLFKMYRENKLKSKNINDFKIERLKIENENEMLKKKINIIEENEELEKFEGKLQQMIYSLESTLSNIQYDNNYISGNIYKNLNNIENKENNLDYVENKSLILEDNYDIIKKNNNYLKRRRYFLMILLFIFGVVLVSVSITIVNDIYKMLNYMT